MVGMQLNEMEKQTKIPPELQVHQSSLHHRFVITDDQKLLISKHHRKQYQEYHRDKVRNDLSTPDLILKSKRQMAEQEAEEEKEIEEQTQKHQQKQRRQQHQQKRPNNTFLSRLISLHFNA